MVRVCSILGMGVIYTNRKRHKKALDERLVQARRCFAGRIPTPGATTGERDGRGRVVACKRVCEAVKTDQEGVAGLRSLP